jgi:CheY-like chemotaxis protein
MNNNLKCIMLVDNNPIYNFLHRRVIKKNNLASNVLTKNSGIRALEYLESKKDTKDIHPDLIFLDINMPEMNGWEFLQEYDLLEKKPQNAVIIIMLANSRNHQDIARAKKWSFVSDHTTKPLTKAKMKVIIDKHFSY